VGMFVKITSVRLPEPEASGFTVASSSLKSVVLVKVSTASYLVRYLPSFIPSLAECVLDCLPRKYLHSDSRVCR